MEKNSTYCIKKGCSSTLCVEEEFVLTLTKLRWFPVEGIQCVGRASERKKITADSGIYKLPESGAFVMADRSFELNDDLSDLPGVSINIPC